MRIIRNCHSNNHKEKSKAIKTMEPIEVLRSFDENFSVRAKIKAGEVYLTQLPDRIGAELRGEHFVVALTNSNPDNPTVLAVPLKSLKLNEPNPTNTLLLGTIEGINNGKQSVALINQIQHLDKKRFVRPNEIDLAFTEAERKNSKFNELVCVLKTICYRLTVEQFNSIKKTVNGFLWRNCRAGKK